MARPEDWVPDACTLPTSERPLRVTEFDELFDVALQSTRCTATHLDVVVPRGLEAVARDLARRESECCAFFTFEFEQVDDGVLMRIGVPPSQRAVLDALASRIPPR